MSRLVIEVGKNDGFRLDIGTPDYGRERPDTAFYSSTERAKMRADLLAEVGQRFDAAFVRTPES